MLWSLFFPGYGQIMLGEYIQGWILFLWEMFVKSKTTGIRWMLWMLFSMTPSVPHIENRLLSMDGQLKYLFIISVPIRISLKVIVIERARRFREW
jgi:TM2 domain-containing membrane protein YozV